MKRIRSIFYILSLLMVPIVGVNAQTPSGASVFVPMDHWIYPILSRLQDRGMISSLNPSVRPYTRLEIINAIQALPQDKLRSFEKYWISLILTELHGQTNISESEYSIAQVSLQLNVSPEHLYNRNTYNYIINPNVDFQENNFAFALRGHIERDLKRDSGYTGRKTSYFGARTDQAYALFQWKRLRFFAGRFSSNWSPFHDKSLIVSSNPLSYDRFGFSYVSRYFSTQSFVAQLDPAYNASRYLSAHRFDVHLPNGMHFGVSETVIHGHADRKQPMDWRYLNPLNTFAEVQLNGNSEANENIAFDAFIPVNRFVFKGQFLVDDFILDGADQPAPNRKTSPDRLGFLISLIGNDLMINKSQIQFDFERISSYTYNLKSNKPWQSYTFEGRGLGSPRNDRDAWILTWRSFAFEKYILSVETGLFRQGERNLNSHDFNDSTMTVGKFPKGLVEKNWRFGVQADYFHTHNIWATLKIASENIRNRSNNKKPLRHYLNVLLSFNYQVDRYFNM